jgi:hypothetical protein
MRSTYTWYKLSCSGRGPTGAFQASSLEEAIAHARRRIARLPRGHWGLDTPRVAGPFSSRAAARGWSVADMPPRGGDVVGL